MGNTIAKIVAPRLLLCLLFGSLAALAQNAPTRISFLVLDPNGHTIPHVTLFLRSHSGTKISVTTSSDGRGSATIPASGRYTVEAAAIGFARIRRTFDLASSAGTITLQFEQVSTIAQQVVVSADVSDIAMDSPDPSQKVMVREELLKVLANNITIREAAPFAALRGDLGKYLRFYAGVRHDQIELQNADLMKPANSLDEWRGFENPKATLAWAPRTGPVRWLPSASFSISQGFFTEDPRISVAGIAASGSAVLASPFERSHSEQLVLEKEFSTMDLSVTLDRTTMTATLAKIDPDTGLARDQGPGTLKFLTASLRHPFNLGTFQAVFSKADARDNDTGLPTPEAPRTIFDTLLTLDRLPFGLRGRSEYEYVGHKLLDVGSPNHPGPYEAVPVGETRMALVHPFLKGMELGADGELARGYTGQTTETFAPGWQIGDAPPACPPGVGGVANDFDCGTVERSVGIRMVSWIGGSVSWRFGAER
jgi:hypothetical protein